MGQAIPPSKSIDGFLLDTIEIKVNPEWDGNSWETTHADIDIDCHVSLLSGTNRALRVGHTVIADDLPQQGKKSLDDLYDYLEDLIVAKYP